MTFLSSGTGNKDPEMIENGRAALRAAEVLKSLQAGEIRIYDVRRQPAFTDFCVIATGKNKRHLRAMADILVLYLRSRNCRVLGVEGRGGSWVAVDCGPFVIHLMDSRLREYYEIDSAWRCAQISLEDVSSLPAAESA